VIAWPCTGAACTDEGTVLRRTALEPLCWGISGSRQYPPTPRPARTSRRREHGHSMCSAFVLPHAGAVAQIPQKKTQAARLVSVESAVLQADSSVQNRLSACSIPPSRTT